MFEVQKLFHVSKELQDREIVSHDRNMFLEALEKLGVDVRDYPEHKMWLLDYNMIEAIKNHPVVNECRGLIMSYDGTIVRKGFNRFYNLGENGVDDFDFKNSTAYEKADGSLCFVYWCESTQRWEIGTRGTAFAEGPNEWHGTFRNAMLDAMGRTEIEFQNDCHIFDRGLTRLYEYISPDNRIVTPYKESMLVALAYIDSETGSEIVAPVATMERSMGWNVREIREYKFDNLEHCMAVLHDLPDLQEGYVLYNHLTKDRAKMKSPAYVAAHRIRGNGLTLNSICELVAMGEVDEYVAVFPEDEAKFAPAIEMLAEMKVLLINNYLAATNYTEQFKGLPHEQREFALYIKDMSLSGVMFKARKEQCDVIHAFNQFPVNKRAEWLKDRLIEDEKERII